MGAHGAFRAMRHRPPRRTRAHLDDLIDGRPTTSDPLAGLVAAVRAPAQPHELGGLESALAAFAAAPVAPLTPEEKTPMLKSVAGRLLALKVLAVTAGAAAAGGVAYAATTGDLSVPHGQSALHANAHSSGAPESDDESSSSEGTDSSSASSPAESGSSSESDESGSAAPSPSLVGLCHAWLAHPSNNAKLSTNPAYSVLVTAAGGVDAVNGYCATVLASAHPTQAQNSSHSHPAHPSQAQNSSHSHPAHPTGAATTPAAKPTVIPSHSHPAGKH